MLFSELPYLCRCFFALLLSSPGSLFHCSTSAYLPPCLLVFPSTVPFPPSEGAQFPYIFYSPSEGAQKPHCPESHLYPHFPTHRAIPTFRRWAGSPHFLLTFRRCAEAALPLELPVASFPHPSYHSHLPKVCSFPTFSTHLPKVRRSTAAPRAACSLISPPTVPFPPSEGVQFPYIFYSPSEGAQKPHCPESHLYPHFPTHRAIPTFRRWAGSPHFLLTFRRCAEKIK